MADTTNVGRTELSDDATEVAQAAPTGLGQPIGTVDTISGSVTVTHADGTQSTLSAGSPVFQGDTLETSQGGAVGITLADETTFSMAENGRMVLDEMVYDPGSQSGSISLSVVEGVFTFVSGQIAKTDPDAMALHTPVATIGIRGTQVGIDVGENGRSSIVLMEEKDGFVGEVVVKNDGGLVVMNGANQGTTVLTSIQPPGQIVTLDNNQLIGQFGPALQHLNVNGNSANNYDVPLAEGQKGGDQAKTEQTQTEELAKEQLAGEPGQGKGEKAAEEKCPSSEHLGRFDAVANGGFGSSGFSV